MSRHTLLTSGVMALCLLVALNAAAAEFAGEVVAVTGEEVTIEFGAARLATVGALVELSYVTSRGLELPVGRGRLTQVQGKRATARMLDTSTPLRKGLLVKIIAAQSEASQTGQITPPHGDKEQPGQTGGQEQTHEQPNLIVNGSFEAGRPAGKYITLRPGSEDLPGWTVTQGTIDVVGTSWKSADGERSLDMNGTPGVGAIEQSFDTIAGKTYAVTFDLAGNFDCGNNVKQLEVRAAGQQQVFSFDSTGKTHADMGWVEKRWTFNADADRTTLAFVSRSTDNCCCGPVLDNVVLHLVPESPVIQTTGPEPSKFPVDLPPEPRPTTLPASAEGDDNPALELHRHGQRYRVTLHWRTPGVRQTLTVLHVYDDAAYVYVTGQATCSGCFVSLYRLEAGAWHELDTVRSAAEEAFSLRAKRGEQAGGKTEPGPGVVLWSKTFGGAKREMAHAIQTTSDGGYVVAGMTESSGAGESDAWVLKLDAEGALQWQRTYGGLADDLAVSIQETADGGYIMGGQSHSFGAGDLDGWIVRLDSQGAQVWAGTFGGEGTEEMHTVRIAPDGGYVAAGYSASYGRDTWLIKLDTDGNKRWERIVRAAGGADDDDGALAIHPTGDGGYIVSGLYEGPDKGAFLLKLDAQGSQEWLRVYGTGDDQEDGLYAVLPAPDGGYIAAGFTGSYTRAGQSDAWVLKVDAQGQQEWARTFGAAGEDIAYAMQPVPQGGYIIVGTTTVPDHNRDAWVLKIDAQGRQEWSRTLGDVNEDAALAVVAAADGGYVIAGYTEISPVGNTEAWVVKLAGDGPR